MARYSIAGYMIALKVRSRHTIMSEGKYDRMIVKYCLLKAFRDNAAIHDKYVVDTAEIIESDGINISNSAKVKAIHREAVKTNIHDNVTCFTDREFMWFDLFSEPIDLQPNHRVENRSLFYTRGHSIENYFFDLEMILDYLEFNHANELKADYRTVITQNWNSLIITAATVSIVAANADLLARSVGLFNIEHWISNGTAISFDVDAYCKGLISRGVDSAAILRIIKDYQEITHKLIGKQVVCRWLSHGHIGLNVICSGIAKLLNLCGMERKTCEYVIGHSDLKLKYLCEKWYVKYSSDERAFPVALFERIKNVINA